MKARSIYRDLTQVDDRSFIQVVIWKVPQPVRGCSHNYKYRLAYVVDDECVLRYDNEAGKGDHVHFGDREEPYAFTSIEKLLGAFLRDVGRRRG